MHYPSAASARATTPADEKLGARIRFARLARGMSQERLAEALGVTFQQVQKYEKATNRIPATRLPQIATALGVPVTQLLPKLDSEPMAPLPVLSLASSELLSIYAEITPAARASLLSIARTIAVATAPKRCPVLGGGCAHFGRRSQVAIARAFSGQHRTSPPHAAEHR